MFTRHVLEKKKIPPNFLPIMCFCLLVCFSLEAHPSSPKKIKKLEAIFGSSETSKQTNSFFPGGYGLWNHTTKPPRQLLLCLPFGPDSETALPRAVTTNNMWPLDTWNVTELRCAGTIKYTLILKASSDKKMKDFSLIILKILISYWNDNILDILG